MARKIFLAIEVGIVGAMVAIGYLDLFRFLYNTLRDLGIDSLM